MKHVFTLLTICYLSTVSFFSSAQEIQSGELFQVIRGKVFDQVSKMGLPGASIMIQGSDPLIGGTTDGEGNFLLEKVPTGRVNLRISFLGYEPTNIREMPVTSGKEVILEIPLSESLEQLNEVVVTSSGNPQDAANEWALDIQNVFNNQNLFRQTFNPITQQIVRNYQLGFFPIPQYRLTF